MGAQPGSLVGVIGEAVAGSAVDLGCGVVLVAVEVDRDFEWLGVQPDEIGVGASSADGVLQFHPPAGDPVRSGEAKFGHPRAAAIGFARDGEWRVGPGSPVQQRVQEPGLQFALHLVDEGNLIGTAEFADAPVFQEIIQNGERLGPTHHREVLVPRMAQQAAVAAAQVHAAAWAAGDGVPRGDEYLRGILPSRPSRCRYPVPPG